MREEEVAVKSRNIQVTILQWYWSPGETFPAEREKVQQIEEHVFIDVDLRNEENRIDLLVVSETSRCIIEKRDRWDGWRYHWGNDIGL